MKKRILYKISDLFNAAMIMLLATGPVLVISGFAEENMVFSIARMITLIAGITLLTSMFCNYLVHNA